MSNGLPSAGSEPSGDKKSSADGTPNKHHEKQDEIVSKKPSVGSLVELIVSGAIIPWIWSEMVGCHEFSKLGLMALALFCCYIGICHFLYTTFSLRPFSAISLWVILSVGTSAFVWWNCRPPPTPTEAFTISTPEIFEPGSPPQQDRAITAEQVREFVQIATTAPKGHVVVDSLDNPESESYAGEMAAMLAAAGYDVSRNSMPTFGSFIGLGMSLQNTGVIPPHAGPLQHRLQKVGIVPTPMSFGNRLLTSNDVEIMVSFGGDFERNRAAFERTPSDIEKMIEDAQRPAPDRTINHTQMKMFADFTEHAPKGTVLVERLDGDPEADFFGLGISEMLRNAKYNVKDGIFYSLPVPKGLMIKIKTTNNIPLEAGPIQMGFSTIGVPLLGVVDRNLQNSNDIEIMVGTKP